MKKTSFNPFITADRKKPGVFLNALFSPYSLIQWNNHYFWKLCQKSV